LQRILLIYLIEMPRFSIITVCFNSSTTIEETIESVLGQTFKDIEYIIIDGASIDSTLTIIEKYKGNISKIVSEPDSGIYDAMNKGISIATGDIIGILNSDDLYMNTKVLQRVSDFFDSKPSTKLLFGNLVYFGKSIIKRHWQSKPYYQNFFDDGNAIPHPALFVKKTVYEKFGVYNKDFKISSDYEFTLRVLKKHNQKISFINEDLIRMRFGGESTSSLKNIWIGNKEILESWKMNKLVIPKFFFIKKIYRKLLQLF
jgi:glycosyltransferase involved in cell wall biosynthesis